MRSISNSCKHLFSAVLLSTSFFLSAQNQTPTVSPILTDEEIPYRLRIELQRNCNGENLLVPGGIQSYVWGDHNRKIYRFGR